MQTSSCLIRRVQYYETDSMKLAHHSNYVNWMEEARLAFFKEAGFNWAEMERQCGIMIPVLYQSVEYKKFLCFDDVFKIICTCEKFNGVKLNFTYSFYSLDERTLHATGKTRHGFINRDYMPVSLEEQYPKGFLALTGFLNGLSP